MHGSILFQKAQYLLTIFKNMQVQVIDPNTNIFLVASIINFLTTRTIEYDTIIVHSFYCACIEMIKAYDLHSIAIGEKSENHIDTIIKEYHWSGKRKWRARKARRDFWPRPLFKSLTLRTVNS